MESPIGLILFTICCPPTSVLIAIFYVVNRAPRGYQDDDGWHPGEPY